jgi:hypothetical protein
VLLLLLLLLLLLACLAREAHCSRSLQQAQAAAHSIAPPRRATKTAAARAFTWVPQLGLPHALLHHSIDGIASASTTGLGFFDPPRSSSSRSSSSSSRRSSSRPDGSAYQQQQHQHGRVETSAGNNSAGAGDGPHKPLWPHWSRSDVAMFVLTAITLFIAAGGGIGGGAVFVPLFIWVGGE